MSKIKYIFAGLIAFVPFMLCAATVLPGTNVLPETSLLTVPLPLHHDAREFYSAVNPVLERNKVVAASTSTSAPVVTSTPTPISAPMSATPAPAPINPYELFFDAVICGDMLKLKTTTAIDQDVNLSLSFIMNKDHPVNSKWYLIEISNNAQFVASNTPSFAEMNAYISEFNTKFKPVLKPLLGKQNIFAYFVQGVMDYESGLLNNDSDIKSKGEKYLIAAAAGFLTPALTFLKWKFGLDTISEMNKIQQSVILNNNMSEIVKYYISESVIDKQSKFADLLISANVGSNLTPNYLKKLIQSAFRTPGFDQAFYKNAFKHFKKTSGGQWRGSYLTTSSLFWKPLFIGRDLIITGLCANQVYLGLTADHVQQVRLKIL